MPLLNKPVVLSVLLAMVSPCVQAEVTACAGDKSADCIGQFSEGLAAVSLDGKVGYIDLDGRMVIEPQFLSADIFFNGIATAVDAGGRAVGYIDRSGRWAISPRFTKAGNFGKEGVAIVYMDGRQSFIDRTGKVVKKMPENVHVDFHDPDPFPAGLAAASQGYPNLLVNLDGRTRQVPEGVHVEEYDPGAKRFAAYIVKDRSRTPRRFGVLDDQMHWVVPPQFARMHLWDIAPGLATVTADNEHWAVLDMRTGARLSPYGYVDMRAAAPGLWLGLLEEDGPFLLLDDHGKVLRRDIEDERISRGSWSQRPEHALGSWFFYQPDESTLELVRADGTIKRYRYPKKIQVNLQHNHLTVELIQGTDTDCVVSPCVPDNITDNRGEIIALDGEPVLSGHMPPHLKTWELRSVEPNDQSSRPLPLALIVAHPDQKEGGDTGAAELGIVTASGKLLMNLQWKEFPEWAASYAQDVIVVKAVPGYGAIDGEGRWVIQPEYDELGDFEQGWAEAAKAGQHLMVSLDGKAFKVPEQYDQAPIKELPAEGGWVPMLSRRMPREGLLAVNWGIEYRQSGSEEFQGLRYFDKAATSGNFYDLAQGGFISAKHFDEAGEFRHGLGAVREGKLWGLIDREGQWVVPPRYQHLRPHRFISHLWTAGKPDCEEDEACTVLLTGDGRYTVEPWMAIYRGLSPGDTEAAEVLSRNHSPQVQPGLLNDGTHVVHVNDAGFRGAPLHIGMTDHLLTGDWLLLNPGGLHGYVDAHGNWRIPPQYYLNPEPFVAGPDLASVTIRRDQGDHELLIDPEGRTVFDAGFGFLDLGRISQDGLFYVERKNPERRVFYSQDGKERFTLKDHAVPLIGEGRVIDEIDDRTSVYDYNGKELFETGADTVGQYSQGLATRQYKADGQAGYGYINQDGKSAFLGRYVAAGEFHEDRAVVRDKTGYRVIDRNGRTVVWVDALCGREILRDGQGLQTWPVEPIVCSVQK